MVSSMMAHHDGLVDIPQAAGIALKTSFRGSQSFLIPASKQLPETVNIQPIRVLEKSVVISKVVLEHVVMHRNRFIFSDVESAEKGHNQKIVFIKIKKIPVLFLFDE
jgi:hypothetical protein